MFSKIMTKKSTRSYSDNIDRLKQAIADADAVIIGAGAGLSTSAGFTYSGERFKTYFADFEENTDSTICTEADFTHMKRWKNTGDTGADTYISTDICLHRKIHMINYLH